MDLHQYIESIARRHKLGNSTEHTFRGDLQQLIETIVPHISATNEPKRIACGAPDYVLMRNDIPIGFIEAKDVGDSDLDGIKKTGNKSQFDRYKASLNNLVFTDYLDFRFYRNGEFVTSIRIGEVSGNRVLAFPENFETFENLLKDFCLQVTQTIKSSQRLAELMAGKARLLADIIEKSLIADLADDLNSATELEQQMLAFKDVLIHDITPKQFADVYSQTIAYGMFAARLHDPTLPTFSREEAAQLIPKTNPFLRKLFQFIAGYDLDTRIRWVVDSLVEVFLACNVLELLRNYGKSTAMSDPIIHFYETFLSEYDPSLRKQRGVWYTPAPVVDFMVRAVDYVLKTEFKLITGLADTSKVSIMKKDYTKATTDKRSKVKLVQTEKQIHRVQILDPATGTGTFLAQVIKHIQQKFKGQEGVWSKYVEDDLIPRLNGFEILMASYAMAHLQLDLLLSESGFIPLKEQRMRVYLTNSLEEHHIDTGTLFANWLSAEANEANFIKRDTPVLCVIGNPPYSGESSNKGQWIMNLMEDYKKEPGGIEKLKEKNPKWINDDYVKFMRYAQHFVEKNDSGILAFINPHGFLDNPTFRGMRWNLLKTYDKLYVLDLHGNTKKKEVSPDGTIDQNVFDIMQGVSINIFIKNGNKQEGELGEAFHYDLYGKRDFKYDFLSKNDLKTIPFVKIPCSPPNYVMIQKDVTSEAAYQEGFQLSKLFQVHNIGAITARDSFTIHSSTQEVKYTIENFLSLDDESARAHYNLGKDARDWKVSFARKDLLASYPNKGSFTKVAYRPFDERWTYYTGNTKGFHCYPRQEVLKHLMSGDNIGLVFRRQQPESNDLYVFTTKFPMIDGFIRSDNKGGESVAPLFLYQPSGQLDFAGGNERVPNFNSDILDRVSTSLSLTFSSESSEESGTYCSMDLFDYIYAILHHKNYRKKYSTFLKTDFPWVPFPTILTFWELVKLGGMLRSVHLMESPKVDDLITSFPRGGSNKILKKITNNDLILHQDQKLGRIFINDEQYFDNIPLKAWEMFIGGYQPCLKWLKDRRGKETNF